MSVININNKHLTTRDMRFFKAAQKVSSDSDHGRGFKVGCVAVLGNKIISSGHNAEKTSPLQMKYAKYYPKDKLRVNKYEPKYHAEVDCLHYIIDHDEIPWNKVKLYIFRSCKSGVEGLSRPCTCCMRLIKDLGIKHIYYSTNAGYSHEILL